MMMTMMTTVLTKRHQRLMAVLPLLLRGVHLKVCALHLQPVNMALL